MPPNIKVLTSWHQNCYKSPQLGFPLGRHMKFFILPLVTTLMFASVAGATPTNNSTGLANPGQTIDFNADRLAQYAPVDNAYANNGVSFSNLYQDTSYSGSSPNISGGDTVRFGQSPPLPFTISFAQDVNEAAFVLVTNNSSIHSVIESFLDGALVETALVFTSPVNYADFYGFSDSLFD